MSRAELAGNSLSLRKASACCTQRHSAKCQERPGRNFWTPVENTLLDSGADGRPRRLKSTPIPALSFAEGFLRAQPVLRAAPIRKLGRQIKQIIAKRGHRGLGDKPYLLAATAAAETVPNVRTSPNRLRRTNSAPDTGNLERQMDNTKVRSCRQHSENTLRVQLASQFDEKLLWRRFAAYGVARRFVAAPQRCCGGVPPGSENVQ